MASVNIVDVVKSYGAQQVLHGVSIDIPDAAFVVLVGPSGCGKSTLLRMIAGLEDISGGTISIGGRQVNNLPPKERDISMVFQNYALYPHMTVAENMAFSLTLAGASKADKAAQVARAAEILDLSHLLDRFPRQLSGGQRQRVAMGRSIVRNPKVFLFDEPLSNLDAKLRVAMRAEIKALHHRLKTTIVYVTHDQVEAMTMADQIVVMNAGRVEQMGAPLDLYDAPANTFVATFIGSPSMNLLKARVVTHGGELAASFADTFIPIPANVGVKAGQDVICGVRPEHLTVSASGMAGQVLVVEPTGSETHVLFKVAGQTVAAVFRDRMALSLDSTIHLTPLEGAVHFFDQKSGNRL